MIKETDGEKYEEARSVIQELTFQEAEQEFRVRGIDFGAAQQKTLKLINEEGLYTNLGLLLSDQCVHTVKLAVFEGTTKAIFKDRREAGGSLLKQLREAYEYIDRYNRIHAEFQSLYRIDKRDYPEEAMREALLNALVHREYSFSDSILISVFDDRIEMVSIGGLVKGIGYDDIMLGVSAARNANLANVFYRLGLIEAYGTGMPRILRSYENELMKPRIQVTDNAFKITLPNRNFNYEVVREKGFILSENEQFIMEMIETREPVTRKEVEDELLISQAMAVRVLKALIDKRLIRAIGGGKNTRYVSAAYEHPYAKKTKQKVKGKQND